MTATGRVLSGAIALACASSAIAQQTVTTANPAVPATVPLGQSPASAAPKPVAARPVSRTIAPIVAQPVARAPAPAAALPVASVSTAVAAVPVAPIVTPVAAPAVAPSPAEAVLHVGTEVPLKLSEELTTKGKKLRLGQRFRMETTAPVIVRGLTAIPVGSPAMGEITEVRNKGGWGKSGHFTGQILYVSVEGRQIRLTGTFDDKGKVGTGAVVGAVLASPLIVAPFMGFFVTGTSAQLPMGTPVKGFVNEEVALVASPADQAPFAVQAAATPATSTTSAATAIQPAPVGASGTQQH